MRTGGWRASPALRLSDVPAVVEPKSGATRDPPGGGRSRRVTVPQHLEQMGAAAGHRHSHFTLSTGAVALDKASRGRTTSASARRDLVHAWRLTQLDARMQRADQEASPAQSPAFVAVGAGQGRQPPCYFSGMARTGGDVVEHGGHRSRGRPPRRKPGPQRLHGGRTSGTAGCERSAAGSMSATFGHAARDHDGLEGLDAATTEPLQCRWSKEEYWAPRARSRGPCACCTPLISCPVLGRRRDASTARTSVTTRTRVPADARRSQGTFTPMQCERRQPRPESATAAAQTRARSRARRGRRGSSNTHGHVAGRRGLRPGRSTPETRPRHGDLFVPGRTGYGDVNSPRRRSRQDAGARRPERGQRPDGTAIDGRSIGGAATAWRRGGVTGTQRPRSVSPASSAAVGRRRPRTRGARPRIFLHEVDASAGWSFSWAMASQ